MQILYYFCTMKSLLALILFVSSFSLDDIILDIYNDISEISNVDYEQLQADLYALHDVPINLNNTSEEELRLLCFLNDEQIDDILSWADRKQFYSVYELKLIQSLEEYEIRDMLPFVYVGERAYDNKLYGREVFAKGQHELLTRVDARNIENTEDGSDPMYAQVRYKFDFQRRVTFGAQLRRPAGGNAKDLQYGGYVQLKDISKHIHTVVAGNYQASFGLGLVLAPVYHTGKTMYIASTARQNNGLRYYSSVDGQGLHGAGATIRHAWDKNNSIDVSALYSMKRANDSTWHHLIGANLTYRHKKLEVQLTAIENIWSDSIRPYRNAKYNRHYFRGYNQAVLGASVRYKWERVDAFAEVSTAQNYERWGFGVLAGSRFYPAAGVSFVALYRYYSPYFDNAMGYGFSESSRLGDEQGGYLGVEVTSFWNWRIKVYGDVFHFSEYKYGLGNDTNTVGFDVLGEMQYLWGERYKKIDSEGGGNVSLRLRARKKGASSTYSGRAQVNWSKGGWSLRTNIDANYVSTYGVSIAQDVGYNFHYSLGNSESQMSVLLRLQAFDARDWDNRIYLYENDVLYAFSIPASYGLGGRAYLCLKWQIIPQLTLYCKVSETVYESKWASSHDRAKTRTDVHILLRIKL